MEGLHHEGIHVGIEVEKQLQGSKPITVPVSVEVVMEDDVFQFRASHESIKTGLRHLRRPNEGSVGDEVVGGRRSHGCLRR